MEKSLTISTAEIADALDLLAKLLELHDENTFKAKSYSNTAFRLSRTNIDLGGKTKDELEKMEGIGKSAAKKIVEMKETGTIDELEKLLEKTPAGVIEMMSVKGLGPKKVRQLWKELGIESVGELEYACDENRLVDLKGFGEKTQITIKKNIEFRKSSAGKAHYGRIIDEAELLLAKLKKKFNTELVSFTGEVYRRSEILNRIDVLVGSKQQEENIRDLVEAKLPVNIIFCDPDEFYYKLVETSAVPDHFSQLHLNILKTKNFNSEEEVYAAAGLQYVAPELRECMFEIDAAKNKTLPKLLEFDDLKGILHNHSTYSDGLNTLEEMAAECRKLGYEYFGIADHSKTAAYAKGLSVERIYQQHEEIDKLNEKLAPFRIFKGIESDILNDGSLDYDDDVLQSFDYIVASVHSNLKMNEATAMKRLITAIENPYTTILGHPSGRLLLSRSGYPLDYKKIIDACAANGVVIELNAHPYRLDIDWRWIPYCMEKSVMISVNPDAHHVGAFRDMFFGVCAARKGMLTKEMCFNAFSRNEMENYLSERLR